MFESYNYQIWHIVPKHLYSGKKIIEIATFMSAGVFNEGYYVILKMMELLEIKLGEQCRFFANSYDAQRLRRQERRSLSNTREARMLRKQEQLANNELFEEVEGLLYAPGIAD